MSKIFSPLNLLTIVVVVGVAYLGYNQIFNSEKELSQKDSEKQESSEKESASPDKLKTENKKETPEKEHQTPTPEIMKKQEDLSQKRLARKNRIEKETQQQEEPGFYESQTYNYQVTYPSDWPLKVRNKEIVAFGYTYPENGKGAVKVKVKEDIGSEIQKATSGGRGVSVEEKQIRVDGVTATKYIFNNSMTNSKTFKIVVENYGYDYIIEYPAESPAFVSQAEKVVADFEFTQ